MTKRYWHDLVDGTLVENIPLAELTTDPATSISETEAQLNGSVDALEGNTGQLDYFFEWGEVGAGFPNSTTPASTSTVPVGYSGTISNLSADTDYEFRAAGTVDGETFTGGTQTFTTQRAIPDSVVTWTPDSVSSGNQEQQGVYFNSTVDWSAFGATLGNSSGGVTKAYVYEKSDLSNAIATKDISGVGDGGSFTIDVSLSSGIDYVLVADDGGNGYKYDFDSGGSFPKTSDDGQLTLEDGYKVGGGNTGESIPHVFKAIGNVQ